MKALDTIDQSILSELQSDARLPNVTLANRVGLSPSACSRRVDALEKSGIIKGYHARLSLQGLGHPIVVIVCITLEGQSVTHLSAFEAAVKECPNVLVCYLMSGTSDYLLRVAAKDLEDYERIHKEWLSSMPGVARMTSSFALREVLNNQSINIKAYTKKMSLNQNYTKV
ncbi:Lrp/AsnC family transcriptional regulator [Candidatus Endowatersipora endosymbiont of Watersipora subatra]|uniref:Lrp/AsnC family transcriptional regulator n=1 Tax=Candidatus Endowatersipora endosymbiont of Watersipora subatra TaxID=3077946 RepID=UPI00312CAF7F